MQEHQENYNDASVSLPKGYVGIGNDISGRNYSPSWGGAFENGGSLNFLQPTSSKLPSTQIIPYRNRFSSEIAQSIGGEDGEPAYLIPSFKYGKPLENPIEEFKQSKDILGGPFKTWQEADKWENTVRHPYVAKGEDIPTPLKTWGEGFAMGGNIPGAVGFNYARTGDIPSNGKHAKKTKASALNGTEMKFYQEGNDFIPKSISRDGSEIKKLKQLTDFSIGGEPNNKWLNKYK